jgi:hypothetical protein
VHNQDIPAGFEPIWAVRSLLSTLTVPWWVAGGWAIDLFLGRPFRPHGDIDLMVLERDEHALRTDLIGVDLQLVDPDGRQRQWPIGSRLTAGPHCISLGSDRLPLPTQVLLGAAVGDKWVYHRGWPTIFRALPDCSFERFGVRTLAPEVVLLMKCISGREKDQRDFEAVVRLLSEAQRDWLAGAARRRWRASRRRAGDPWANVSEHPWSTLLLASP